MALSTQLQFVQRAERALGVELPRAFRSHLLRSNGGVVEILEIDWELNPVHDTSDNERTRRTAIDIVRETNEARKWRGFPPGGVSVGSDGCGNHLVFLPDEDNRAALAPPLYIWWHEGGELEAVANDFSDVAG
jgi:SMI1 / KNR4 family (SUKH-1)